jgi:hypothetical protein
MVTSFAMGRSKATLNHGSVYARDPQRAAENVAALTGGLARPFHPCPGAWVCFLSGEDGDWNGQLLEFYARSTLLARDGDKLVFREAKTSPRGAGTHFNLTIPTTRAALESACRKLRLSSSWRAWQGLLEVWLEDDLLIECVPA